VAAALALTQSVVSYALKRQSRGRVLRWALALSVHRPR